MSASRCRSVVWLLWASTGLAAAQEAAGGAAATGNLPAARIGPSDLLGVSVYGAPELTRQVRVSADGLIRLPLLRRQVVAEGLMPAELELKIAEALRSEQILVEPAVTVTIAEYHSRPILVSGAVKRPTTFQAVGVVTVLDALTRAEGLSAEAGPEVLVSRRRPAPEGGFLTVVERIAVRRLMDAADPASNPPLSGGEEIRVPEAARVFVVGNVKRPGSFPVQDAAGTTVLRLLAHCEGLLPHTAKTAYIYRRREASGSQPLARRPAHGWRGSAESVMPIDGHSSLIGEQEIAVPLRRILDRKAPDVTLVANDILYIPDNRRGRISLTALDRILTFGTATASGVLIWGAAR